MGIVFHSITWAFHAKEKRKMGNQREDKQEMAYLRSQLRKESHRPIALKRKRVLAFENRLYESKKRR